MSRYVSTDKYLELQWEGFTSDLDILMYYIAISNNSDANQTSCKNYVSNLWLVYEFEWVNMYNIGSQPCIANMYTTVVVRYV